MECILVLTKQWTCVICHKSIHNGGSECPCSTLRKDAFAWASICIECATSYDKLMTNEEFQPILKHLLRKEYWKDRIVND